MNVRPMMKSQALPRRLTILALALHALLGSALQAQTPATPPAVELPPASAWSHQWGGGLAMFPSYAGSKQMIVLPLPVLESQYRDWFYISSVRGLGLQFRPLAALQLGVAVAPDINVRRSEDLPAAYRQLDKIPMAPALRWNAELGLGRLQLQAALSTRLARREQAGEGSSLELSGDFGLLALPTLQLAVGASAQLMDERLAQAMFGLSAPQAAKLGVPSYQVGEGLVSAGLFARLSYRLNDQWLLRSKLGVHQLQGDAARSPLLQRRWQPELFVLISRPF